MRLSISIPLALALLGATALARPDHAQGPGKHHKENKAHKKAERFADDEKFYATEKQTFQNYYRNLPPGLAKKLRRGGKLPRGWENKIAPGAELPREYYDMRQPVPKELAESVHVGPIGTEIIRIENKIMRLQEATHIILDVFDL